MALHIILLVLKIIGYVLLGILALVLLLILELLFIPFCYKAKVNKEGDTIEAGGKFSWLFGLIRMKINYKNQDISGGAYFLFIKVLDLKKLLSKDDTEEEKEDKEEEEKPKEKKDIKAILNKLSSKKDVLTSDNTKAVIANAIEKTKRIIKHMLPRKIKGYINYSTGSPDSTGYILGLYSIFYSVFKNIKLNADFDSEEVIFDFDLKLKGHVFGIVLLVLIIKIALNKNVLTLITNLKREE